jgi:hypothetical protein
MDQTDYLEMKYRNLLSRSKPVLSGEWEYPPILISLWMCRASLIRRLWPSLYLKRIAGKRTVIDVMFEKSYLATGAYQTNGI